MEGDEDVLTPAETELLPDGKLACGVDRPEERVDHRVADQRDSLVRDPLGREVLVRLRRVGEEQGGDVIGESPVVLLRHPPVEAPQPRLEVADRNVQLDRRERGRERRVDIARDDDEVGL